MRKCQERILCALTQERGSNPGPDRLSICGVKFIKAVSVDAVESSRCRRDLQSTVTTGVLFFMRSPLRAILVSSCYCRPSANYRGSSRASRCLSHCRAETVRQMIKGRRLHLATVSVSVTGSVTQTTMLLLIQHKYHLSASSSRPGRQTVSSCALKPASPNDISNTLDKPPIPFSGAVSLDHTSLAHRRGSMSRRLTPAHRQAPGWR